MTCPPCILSTRPDHLCQAMATIMFISISRAMSCLGRSLEERTLFRCLWDIMFGCRLCGARFSVFAWVWRWSAGTQMGVRLILANRVTSSALSRSRQCLLASGMIQEMRSTALLISQSTHTFGTTAITCKSIPIPAVSLCLGEGLLLPGSMACTEH